MAFYVLYSLPVILIYSNSIPSIQWGKSARDIYYQLMSKVLFYPILQPFEEIVVGLREDYWRFTPFTQYFSTREEVCWRKFNLHLWSLTQSYIILP